MATTQYQIFCRYLNEVMNRALTNQKTVGWIGAEEYDDLVKNYAKEETDDEGNVTLPKGAKRDKYESINATIRSGEKKVSQLEPEDQKIYEKGQKCDEVRKLIRKGQMVVEYCIIEPLDSLYVKTSSSNSAAVKAQKKKEQAARDLELYKIVIAETNANNPKYDMVFMYDGIAYAESRTGEADYNPPENQSRQIPYMYYDRMKRVQLDPWFLFSTHASLASAMTKATELINILGKDAVKIGKVVPLDQYIEIV